MRRPILSNHFGKTLESLAIPTRGVETASVTLNYEHMEYIDSICNIIMPTITRSYVNDI